jgi:ribosomal protein S18 acetylase RimI-like enzyme
MIQAFVAPCHTLVVTDLATEMAYRTLHAACADLDHGAHSGLAMADMSRCEVRVGVVARGSDPAQHAVFGGPPEGDLRFLCPLADALRDGSLRVVCYMATLRQHKAAEPLAAQGTVMSIAVATQLRRRGVAHRLLMDYVCDEAEAAQLGRIRLHVRSPDDVLMADGTRVMASAAPVVQPAQQLYSKCGFVTVSTRADAYGKGKHADEMTLALLDTVTRQVTPTVAKLVRLHRPPKRQREPSVTKTEPCTAQSRNRLQPPVAEPELVLAPGPALDPRIHPPMLQVVPMNLRQRQRDNAAAAAAAAAPAADAPAETTSSDKLKEKVTPLVESWMDRVEHAGYNGPKAGQASAAVVGTQCGPPQGVGVAGRYSRSPSLPGVSERDKSI